MSSTNQELEVKFYLSDLPRLKASLEALGALLEQPRTHEINLRFDTPERILLNSGRLLRLRQDSAVRVTFKGPGSIVGGARLRQELEFTAGDFASAQAVFEALGFEVMMMYEKQRATYRLGTVLVTLDEMPYGSFAEIEGPDGASIRKTAGVLGLDWDKRILDSYIMLFDRLRERLGLAFRDLSFENFKSLTVTEEMLDL